MQYIFTYEDVPLNATGLKGAKNLKYWMGWPLLLLFASVSLQSQKRKYLLSVLRQLVYISFTSLCTVLQELGFGGSVLCGGNK